LSILSQSIVGVVGVVLVVGVLGVLGVPAALFILSQSIGILFLFLFW
jgi:hypothetical protein